MLTLTASALVFSLTSPPELPGRLRAMTKMIAEYGGVGGLNDPSFANRESATILGVDRVAICLGLDRSAARGLQFVVLAALGSMLAHGVLRGTIGEEEAVGLTAIYSLLFLYHRVGDAVLLALPLGWAVARFALAGPSAGGRWRAVLAIACLLFVLHVPGTPLMKLSVRYGSTRSTFGSAVRYLILPAPTGALLAAFAALFPPNGGRSGKSSMEDSPGHDLLGKLHEAGGTSARLRGRSGCAASNQIDTTRISTAYRLTR